MTFRMGGERRLIAVLGAVATLVLSAAVVFTGVAAGAGRPAHSTRRTVHHHGRGYDRFEHQRYTVGLFGDMPYGALGRAQYPTLLADINHNHVAFSVFDGDLQAGGDG